MKVKDLIKQLQQLPADDNITVLGYDGVAGAAFYELRNTASYTKGMSIIDVELPRSVDIEHVFHVA